MKKKYIYIIIAVIIILLIVAVTLIIFRRNTPTNNEENIVENNIIIEDNTKTDEEKAEEIYNADMAGREATTEEINERLDWKFDELPQEVEGKIVDKDKLYLSIKEQAYKKGYVDIDEIKLGQQYEQDNNLYLDFYMKKEGVVTYRAYVTLNLTDNTYTIEFYQ